MTPSQMNEVILCALVSGKHTLQEIAEAIQEKAGDIRKRLDVLIDVGLIESSNGETAKVYGLTAKGAAEVKRIQQSERGEQSSLPEPRTLENGVTLKIRVTPPTAKLEDQIIPSPQEALGGDDPYTIVVQELVMIPRIAVKRAGTQIVLSKSMLLGDPVEELAIPMASVDKLIHALRMIRSAVGVVA